MAYTDYTRPDAATAHRMTLCLTEDECRILLPSVEKALKNVEKKYEKYKDIQEGGEATEKQQDKLFQYEEEYECLVAVLDYMRNFSSRK